MAAHLPSPRAYAEHQNAGNGWVFDVTRGTLGEGRLENLHLTPEHLETAIRLTELPL